MSRRRNFEGLNERRDPEVRSGSGRAVPARGRSPAVRAVDAESRARSTSVRSWLTISCRRLLHADSVRRTLGDPVGRLTDPRLASVDRGHITPPPSHRPTSSRISIVSCRASDSRGGFVRRVLGKVMFTDVSSGPRERRGRLGDARGGTCSSAPLGSAPCSRAYVGTESQPAANGFSRLRNGPARAGVRSFGTVGPCSPMRASRIRAVRPRSPPRASTIDARSDGWGVVIGAGSRNGGRSLGCAGLSNVKPLRWVSEARLRGGGRAELK